MKKKSLLLFILLLILSKGVGQSLDSLMNILSNPDGLSSDQIAAVCLDIARGHANAARYDEALQLLSKVAEAADDSLILSQGFRVKAQILSVLHRLNEVGTAVNLANRWRPRICDPHELAVCNNLTGSVAAFTGDYATAFQYFYRALLIWERAGDSDGVGNALNNLGINYYKFCDYAMAIKYFRSAKGCHLQPQSRRFVLSNLALAYAHLDSSQNALLSLKELCSSNDNLSTLDSISVFYGYGVIYQKLLLHDSARYNFERSLTLSRSSSDVRYMAENSVSLATIDIFNGDFQHAAQLLEEAETAASQNASQDILLRIYEQKILMAKRSANQAVRILAQNQYIQKKSELYNAHLLPIVAASKARFYEKEYQIAIDLHRKIVKQNSQQESNMEILGHMEWAIVVLSVAMLILMGISFKNRKVNACRLERTIHARSNSIGKNVHEMSDLIKRGRSAMIYWKTAIEANAFQIHERDQSKVKNANEIRRAG
jgi:tetratricopeptide (TPR) repeat protein